MSPTPKLSRRDWFRLRVPHQNRMLDQSSEVTVSGEPMPSERPLVSAGLKPIEQPPNHDGLDLAQLPPMREALLSPEQVLALISDIDQLATDILLMQRAAGAQRAEASRADTSANLELAKSALLSGAIPRLQIRYRWQDQQWIDTLKRQPDGFHIVRIAHQCSTVVPNRSST